MPDIKTIRRKELRGKIACALYQQYGHWTQVSSLTNAFARTPGVDTEVPTQIHYLSDPQKGYVAIRYDGEPEITPMRDAYVQLTAAGCNLVEGDIDDPGVIFGDGQR